MNTIEHEIKLVNDYNHAEIRFNSYECESSKLTNNDIAAIISNIMLVDEQNTYVTKMESKIPSKYTMPLLVVNGWEYYIVYLPYFKKLLLCNDRYPMDGNISAHDFKAYVKKLNEEWDEECYNMLMDATNVIKVNVK